MAKTGTNADVIVMGGGLAGMTMSALAAAGGLDVVCIDKDDPARLLDPAFDTRTIAISYGSQHILAAAGAWDEALLNPCPIRDIRILDGGSPVLLEFLGREAGVDAMGWIVESRALRHALLNAIKCHKTIRHIAPANVTSLESSDQDARVHLEDGTVLSAALIIGADGRHSFTRAALNIPVRHWSYDQRAIVCTFIHENPHRHTAIEHFMADGPFAVLPMPDDAQGRHRSALVWSEHKKSRSMMEWDNAIFLAALNARLPDFYGGASAVGKRAAWPLTFTHAYHYTAPRAALVADAAHAIHPIAGQGLNLGLRDIACLADLLRDAKKSGGDIGSPGLLSRYEQARRPDNTAMAAATDALNRLFSRNSKTLGFMRQLGLRAVQAFPPARRFFMNEAMGARTARKSIL